MIDEQIIQKIGVLLAEAAGPSRVILFGSHARNEAGEESDLDLLVVKPMVSNRLLEMTHLRQVLRPLRIPVDLLVCSLSELNERAGMPSGAIYWALQEGRTIHDSLG
ncbi:MAG: nucleotidyltransferase domain-containing protein [Magnetococcales bacterium]|nr:nucleotidyltransferase domain-containing protein [Magnetococcales bacterium]NGZ25347.1 nucleotidyltransferase domain-containing protein [Magnetococcales bacterium]